MKKLLIVFLLSILVAALFFSRGSEVTNNLDGYIYDLPFKEGTGHKVVQGYGGLFSIETRLTWTSHASRKHRFMQQEREPFTGIRIIAMKVGLLQANERQTISSFNTVTGTLAAIGTGSNFEW